jgi:hypothetical protein
MLIWRLLTGRKMPNTLAENSLREMISILKDDEHLIYFTWGDGEFVIIDDLSKIKAFKVTRVNETNSVPFSQVNAKLIGLKWENV